MSKIDVEPELPETPAEVPAVARLRRSPLTDPRALLGSLLVHLLILGVASVLAIKAVVATPDGPAPGRVMRGEVESIDNRAAADSGGSSGDPDGRAADLSVEPGLPAPPSEDPTADALVSEILPTLKSAEVPAETLPGPSTSGLGMLNSSGAGDGTGPSGASGPSGTKPTGLGTEFFGMKDRGTSFAYVIDCSGSMYTRSSLDVAKRELLSSLGRISPEAQFAVIFYNYDAKVFTDPSGRQGMMPATPANKSRVRTLLSTVKPEGGTNHMLALKTAFQFHPEVIFFLTDADFITRQDVAELIDLAGKSRIQAIEFGQVSGLGGSAPLKQLAKSTGGSYRYIDVDSLGK